MQVLGKTLMITICVLRSMEFSDVRYILQWKNGMLVMLKWMIWMSTLFIWQNKRQVQHEDENDYGILCETDKSTKVTHKHHACAVNL
jgi:ABC-type nickel/cobalt efflux system permease component RcnA